VVKGHKGTWNPPKNGGNQIPLKWGELDTFGYQVPYPKKSNQTQNMEWYPKVSSSIPKGPTKQALNLLCCAPNSVV